MTLTEKLVEIQTQIKAPKNLRNTFGGYNYRNAEQICEAFKPYGQQLKVMLTLSDEVVNIGGGNYIKASATLTDAENPVDFVTVTAYAREAEGKKGMDSAQVSGAASSYARKYALNGLFLLDDTKDPDSDEYTAQDRAMSEKKNQKPKEGVKLIAEIRAVMMSKGYQVDAKAEKQLDEMDIPALKSYLDYIKTIPNKGDRQQ